MESCRGIKTRAEASKPDEHSPRGSNTLAYSSFGLGRVQLNELHASSDTQSSRSPKSPLRYGVIETGLTLGTPRALDGEAGWLIKRLLLLRAPSILASTVSVRTKEW